MSKTHAVTGKPLSAAPEKLRLLADWLDVKYPAEDTEAQNDLRHWADLIERLVDSIVDAAIPQHLRQLGHHARPKPAEEET